MGRTLFLGFLLAAGLADAQTMYRCEVNGRVEYSDKPCMEGVEVKRLAPDGGPTPEDRARAQMRVRAEQQRFEAQDRAEAEQRRLSEPGGFPSAQVSTDTAPHAATVSGNQKVTVHTRDGWDRKPQAQIEAEQQAIATGRADGSQSSDPDAWQNEKTMVHTRTGYVEKTRGQVVQEKAAAANAAAKTPVAVSCNPGGCTCSDGKFHPGQRAVGLACF